jgi:uncharacterized protein (TIGR03790 family)
LGVLAACSSDATPAGESGSTTDVPDTTSSSSASTSTTAPGSSSEDSTSSEASSSASSSSGAPEEPIEVFFPRTSIQPEQLGVVVNDNDPLSVGIATYYATARGIPEANVFHLSFATGGVLPEAEFTPIYDDLYAQLPDEILGLALTFTNPYRVDCMSITSAFALGFDPIYCNTTGGACGETAPVDYYDSASLDPWADHAMRPTMMIAATSLEDAQALIDRGIASDGTHPTGDGWFVRTTDPARSVRYLEFLATIEAWDRTLTLDYVDNSGGTGLDYIENTVDVLFYFTGLADVPQIATNTYVPGAIADHLTSYGGQVPESGQMSALRWLEAGATGSFGTVVEPCNILAKFPNTSVLLPHYFRGESLLEAYWKSVWWPGEGLFIGEPLAKPWDGSSWTFVDGTLTITTNLLVPGIDYDVQWAPAPDGPWTTENTGSIPTTQTFDLVVENAWHPYWRLHAVDP